VSFKLLYQSFSTKNRNIHDSYEAKVRSSIEAGAFDTSVQLLEDSNEPAAVNRNLKQEMAAAIRKQCNDVKTSCTDVLAKPKVTAGELAPIVEKLDVFNSVLQLLPSCQKDKNWVDPAIVDLLKKSVAFAREQFQNFINRLSRRIDLASSAANFQEATSHLHELSVVTNTIHAYINDDHKKIISDFEAKQEKHLSDIVERFRTMKIEDYGWDQPIVAFKKLEENKVIDNNVVVQAQIKLREVIVKNFKASIEELSGQYDPTSSKVAKLEAALKYLPQSLVDGIEAEIRNCKDKIADNTKSVEKDVLELLESRKVEDAKTQMKKLENEQSSRFVLDKCKDVVNKFHDQRLKSLLAILAEVHQQNDVTSLGDEIILLVDIQSKFKATLPMLTPSQLKTCVKTKADLAIRILDESLKDPKHFHADAVPSFLTLKAFVALEGHLAAKDDFYTKMVFSPEFSVHTARVMNDIAQFFAKIQQVLEKVELKSFNAQTVKNTLEVLKCAQPLLANVKAFGIPTIATFPALPLPYDDALLKVKSNLDQVIKDVDAIQINDESKLQLEKDRLDLYKDMALRLEVISQMHALSDVLQRNYEDAHHNTLAKLQHKVDDLKSDAAQSLKADHQWSKADLDKFNFVRENLVSIAKHFPDLDGSLKSLEVLVDAKITEAAAELQKHYKLEDATSFSAYASALIQLQFIGNGIWAYKQKCKAKISESLALFKQTHDDAQQLTKLAVQLKKDESGLGKMIVAEEAAFEGLNISDFNRKTQAYGIQYVVDSIFGDGLRPYATDKDGRPDTTSVPVNPKAAGVLTSHYATFDSLYRDIVDKGLDVYSSGNEAKQKAYISGVVNNAQIIAKQVDLGLKSKGWLDYIWNGGKPGRLNWSHNAKQAIIKIMAHVFALWTLLNATHYFQAKSAANQKSYLLQPHASQVVSIFRMLCVDETSSELLNNFVQIGTGEGKSITLAITAATLALLGFNVSCVCYSKYLSQRDHDAFSKIFAVLSVDRYIDYGTFQELCEHLVNENGKIRAIVENMVLKGQFPQRPTDVEKRPMILVIDEVDVFFQKEFYGQLYTPVASLSNPSIMALIEYIWNNRGTIQRLADVKAQPVFKTCCDSLGGKWDFLVEEAVKTMISDVKAYETDAFEIYEDQIGYVEQDQISVNTVHGYKTVFRYLCEVEKKTISRASFEKHCAIELYCGNFSYAEIPHKFLRVLGVTGTLVSLSEPEKKIIEEVYNVKRKTIMPSVFGANLRQFVKNGDGIKVEPLIEYHSSIAREITSRLVGTTAGTKRAVLVFFETKQELEEFYNSPAATPLRGNMKKLLEESNPDEKESAIQRTNSGEITLIMKVFGRGTDFVSRDDIVLANGGIHVIQTFLSAEVSEETQIQGRTARQGAPGSYSMVLLEPSLEKYLITSKEVNQDRDKGQLYDLLNRKRNEFFTLEYERNSQAVLDAKTEHDHATVFINALFDNNVAVITKFLGEQNKGTPEAVKSRTVVLMDATGSMYHLLASAKAKVGVMFERAVEIIKTKSGRADAF